MQQHARTYSVLTHTLDPWGGVKDQTIFFLKVVMLHIKISGMELEAPYKHINCPYTHHRPMCWGQKVKTFLLKVVMLHIKFKGMEHTVSCKHIFCHYTHPNPPYGVKWSNIFGESNHVAYQVTWYGT